MHGVPFRRWQKWAIAALSISAAAGYYWFNPDELVNMSRPILIRYSAVFVCVCMIWLIMRPFVWSGRLHPAIARDMKS